MATKVYSKTGSTITPFKLTNEMLAAVGRTIRACAEIEDIIGLHLCQVSGISEAQSLILIGRMGLREKLQRASIFANAIGGEAAKAQRLCFDDNQEFEDLIRFRNAVAHGLLLGMTDDKLIAFRTVDLSGADETAASVNVISYLPTDFEIYAQMAEAGIPRLEALLRLQPLREKRRKQALFPHRKSQPKRPPSAKHMRQRKPSRPK